MPSRIDPRLVAIAPAEPREFILKGDQASIGSAADNDFVIRDTTVSARHARLWRRLDEYRLADLHSHNGTFVNGVRIEGATAVRDRDQVDFAGASYRFIAAGDAAAPAGLGSAPALTGIAVIAFLLLGGLGLYRFVVNFDRLARADTGAVAGALPNNQSSGTNSAGGAPPVSAATPVEPVPAEDSAEVEAWLGPLNRYRKAAGLAPVTADPRLHSGDYLHSRYIVKNYGAAIAHGLSLGPWMHTEDPAKPWFSKEGLAAARASDVSELWNRSPAANPAWAIDNWIVVPFHRFSLLNPDLRTVGYGTFCENSVCIAALDTSTTGVMLRTAKPLAKPVEFPPDGSSFPVGSSGNEWPDPLSACPGYASPAGLPLSLQLGQFVTPGVSAHSLKSEASGESPLPACAFDANTYVNPDPGTQKNGRELLAQHGAIVIVPQRPLAPGRYTAAITAGGHQYEWSFSISG